MSDTSQGPGWWEASDHKWYPPELHADPDHRQRHAAAPAEPPLAPPDAPPPIEAPPDTAPATPAPTAAAPDMAGASTGRHGLDAGTSTTMRGRPTIKQRRGGNDLLTQPWVWMVGIGLICGAAALLVFSLLTGGGDDESSPPEPRSTATPAQETPPTPGEEPTTPAREAATDQPATGVDEDAGTAPTPEPAGDPALVVGSATAPAAFGQVHEWQDWRGTIVAVVDAEAAGLRSDFDDPPGDGNAHLAVIYEATYLGDEVSSFEPFQVEPANRPVVQAFGCSLDDEALTEYGVDSRIFELVPGQTARFAWCVEVAAEDVPGIAIALDSVFEFESDFAFAADGHAVPPLPPVDVVAGERRLSTSPLGTELSSDAWTAKVTDIVDAVDAGVVSRFGPEPRPGDTYVAVFYEVQYRGAEVEELLPIGVTGVGTAVFPAFGDCWLDDDVLADLGVESSIFMIPRGEPVLLADCLVIPTSELDTAVIRLESRALQEPEHVLYPIGL